MPRSNLFRAVEENNQNEVIDISNRTFDKLENGARKCISARRMIKPSSIPSTPKVDQNAGDKLQLVRLAMVNNAKRSDIVFVVGQAMVKIHAHSPILMMNSEVFDSMFSGDFDVSTEITVTDVEPEIFLQLMNFIYAGLSAVTLTAGNMIDLLYGAQKYMLHGLKKTCEDFILANTNNNNLLEVLDASRLFENSAIKEMCLNVMLDNPLHFFKDDGFKELSPLAIKDLLGQSKINCSEEQLRHHILQWVRHQQPLEKLTDSTAYDCLEAVAGIQPSSFAGKQFFNIKLDSFDQFTTAMFQLNRTVCHPNRRTDATKFLHGIGVYAGVELHDAAETVTITLKERDVDGKSWIPWKTVTEPIKQPRTPTVVDFMFEKVQIERQILITIDFGAFKSRFCVKKTCEAQHDHYKSGCAMFSYDEDVMQKVPYTCVAYLLTTDGPKVAKEDNNSCAKKLFQ